MEEQTHDTGHFINDIIDADLKAGKLPNGVHTRFPPEPNGYLHIGHAKSVILNSGLARQYGGIFNLRFDDTNPTKEDQEYVDSIIEDVKWLGGDFGDHLFYASDYFPQMHAWAVELIKKGKAYVDSQTAEEISHGRGKATMQDGKLITPAGVDSPYRNRSAEENLDLFERMRAGEFKEGEHVLRARIDMAHPNLNMRDPVMYRICHDPHHRQGTAWCIYPMYDWAHGLEDSIEGITHSICTLEFENHRPLYDWFLNELDIYHPQQIEFAKLNITYTVLSKRNLLAMVNEKIVDGWDDPRMPTVSALRRRGVPAAALRNFCARIGVAKSESTIDIPLLEHAIREELNRTALRVMGVLDPLKVIITNYPEDTAEDWLDAVNNPEDPSAGIRKVPFGRELFIEREDFMEEPPSKFFRLAPGREVRLRYAYFITCQDVVKDAEGNIVELHCTYDPATRGGDAPDGRKVKGTLHWVSARHALDVDVRLYETLFSEEFPGKRTGDWRDDLNPTSLTVVKGCKLEPSIADAAPGTQYQFERKGYFTVDTRDSQPGCPVFLRTVTLKDSWAKQQKK